MANLTETPYTGYSHQDGPAFDRNVDACRLQEGVEERKFFEDESDTSF
jgi:hypothetical protein